MKLKIYSDKRTSLCLFTFFYVMFIGFFTYNFGIPEMVYYVLDFLILCLMIKYWPGVSRAFLYKENRLTTIFLVLLIITGTVSAILNGFSIMLWVWSIRNWGRFFFFFYICTALLNKKSIDCILSSVVKIFHVNVVVIILQFIFLRGFMSQDALNGLYGRGTSVVNVTMCLIVWCISLSSYYAGTYSLKNVFTVLLEICLVSILAELRAILVFVVFFAFLYIMVNTKLSGKRIVQALLLMVFFLILVIYAARWLGKIYPEFAGYFTIQGIIAQATNEKGYGYSGYIDRLNGIPIINKFFFSHMDDWCSWIGIGMGNGEYSSFSFLCSPFYVAYGADFRYLNFTSSAIYLEVGIIGLCLYTLIFVSIFIRNVRRIRELNKASGVGTKTVLYYENVGMGVAMLSIIFIIYNNVYRTDVSVLLALFLAIPFAIKRNATSEL